MARRKRLQPKKTKKTDPQGRNKHMVVMLDANVEAARRSVFDYAGGGQNETPIDDWPERSLAMAEAQRAHFIDTGKIVPADELNWKVDA